MVSRTQREERATPRFKMFEELPDSLILKILDYCVPLDVCHIGQLSRTLRDVSSDEILWRTLFHRYFKLQTFNPNPFVYASWKSEFIRLQDEVPIVQCETFPHHGDEVLHVSFSHDGKRFATTGKDAYIRVWNTTTYPVELEFDYKMRKYDWHYTQFSEFNETDSLLLVSGVKSIGSAGEIIIFSLENGLKFICKNINRPYDIFGAWYSDQYFLSGGLTWLELTISKSEIWINKASQEADSEHKAVLNCLYKFYNSASSSVRRILVANISTAGLPELVPGAGGDGDTRWKSAKYENTSNPGGEGNPDDLKNQCKRPIAVDDEQPCSSKSLKVDNEMVDEDLGMETGDEEEEMDSKEKLLIFTCGSETYVPHQIGFKRMKPRSFQERLELGPSLAERIKLVEQKKQRRAEGFVRPGYGNYDRVAHLFDKYDAMLDLKGHIIGMALSPDHRYLYVNCRSWPIDAIISDPMNPPPIAQEIDIHIIDLLTLTEIGKMPRAPHRGFTPNDECFFIFLDANEQYLASGSEDNVGVVWDRNYGIPLCRLPHAEVVNCVGLSQTNPEVAVSVSDDQSIKVWRSTRLCRELGIDLKEKTHGTLLANIRSRR